MQEFIEFLQLLSMVCLVQFLIIVVQLPFCSVLLICAIWPIFIAIILRIHFIAVSMGIIFSSVYAF